MKFTIATTVLALVASAAAGPAARSPNDFFDLTKRATLPVPASKGSVTYKSAKSISGTFDGGLKTYGRGVSCTGQAEGGDADAVFILENGATLKNAIIGKDQIEGVHCKGSCTIENVWWVDVCEGKPNETDNIPSSKPTKDELYRKKADLPLPPPPFKQTHSASRATATPSSRAAARRRPRTR